MQKKKGNQAEVESYACLVPLLHISVGGYWEISISIYLLLKAVIQFPVKLGGTDLCLCSIFLSAVTK
ncbi:MAG: hypothetical protein K2N34_02150 [Lachnospiraceae bacterium]|nr:hypothetical protein [Lachnospiraceae bacterium]